MIMERTPGVKEFQLICAIVNNGTGSKVLHIARHNGISGGTVFLGKGTVSNHLLEALALSDTRKEIVLMAADKELVYNVLEKLNKELKFYKPNHGIGFSIPVNTVIGSSSCSCSDIKKAGGVENKMYQAIYTIVDKGKGETVVEAATKAGSRGATIINARGSGIHETTKLFAMEIEPEKEIVLIISEVSKTEKIVNTIREDLQIDRPGNGIIFVQDVDLAYGLYQ